MAGEGMVTIDDPKNGKVEESTASFIAMSNKLILVSPAKNLEDIKANAIAIQEASEMDENGGAVSTSNKSTPVVATSAVKPTMKPKLGSSVDKAS